MFFSQLLENQRLFSRAIRRLVVSMRNVENRTMLRHAAVFETIREIHILSVNQSVYQTPIVRVI